jgi:large subunit ribosomal protein L15
MAIKLNNLKPAVGARIRDRKRLGRGNATGKGTTAGKGTKGQKARTGGRNYNRIRGIRRLVLQTPKLRGFKRQRPAEAVVNLRELQEQFQDGAIVTVRALQSKGLVPSNVRRVKILGQGILKKGLKVQGCRVSESAKERILAAGGEVR